MLDKLNSRSGAFNDHVIRVPQRLVGDNLVVELGECQLVPPDIEKIPFAGIVSLGGADGKRAVRTSRKGGVRALGDRRTLDPRGWPGDDRCARKACGSCRYRFFYFVGRERAVPTLAAVACFPSIGFVIMRRPPLWT